MLMRISTLSCLLLFLFVLPATAKIAVFNQQDIAKLTEITEAIESLRHDVDITKHSLPTSEFTKVAMCAIIERDLAATEESIGVVRLLAELSAKMETWNDQVFLLAILFDRLPTIKQNVAISKDSIIIVASAASDNMIASYASRAANIINQALPLLDRLYHQVHPHNA